MNINKIPWAMPTIGKEELSEVIDSFEANWLTMGPKVLEFEKRMADLLNVPHAIAVSNGTVALDIALKTIGIKTGDEVIIPAMTYFATASAVNYQNAIPVFVDIERESFNLDPTKIEEGISNKTKAIIFIDYGGNPSNYDEIAKIGKKHGIPVVQDAAQSLGSIYRGNPMGAQTEISTMSFHMAKVMTCIEGGMIFTHNEKYKNEILSRRNHGEPINGKYKHELLGTNARLTDLHAGIGLAQLIKLPYMLNERKRVARKYNELIYKSGIDVKTVSTKNNGDSNAYFFYPILVKNRDYLAKILRDKHNIDTRIAYPMPVYKQQLYKSRKATFRKMKCPVAEQVTSEIINLPIFPGMTNKMIETVVDKIKFEIIQK